ncbi:hypothetical protein [Shewanella woodyi]|uniref:hypothetical protein n=1 Tax=Shewanella woodyi TaxID=60961 RepID=UPI003748084C
MFRKSIIIFNSSVFLLLAACSSTQEQDSKTTATNIDERQCKEIPQKTGSRLRKKQCS